MTHVFKNTKHEPDVKAAEIDRRITAYVDAQLKKEDEELEVLVAECVALSDFERIDDIFIGVYPDGRRTVQSWWNKPEWMNND